MNLRSFLQTWAGSQLEQRYTRMALLVLTVANLGLVGLWYVQEPPVIIVPPTLNHEVTVARASAHRDYLESWALYLAELLGNVTPGNAKLVSAAIGPLLSADIYQEAMAVMERQVYEITENRMEQRFTPRRILSEDGKIFVNGLGVIQGPVGDPKRWEKTYEFVIEISKYRPVIKYLQLYSGEPRTQEERQRLEQKAEDEHKEEPR